MILKWSSKEKFRLVGEFDVIAGQKLNVFLNDDLDGFPNEN